METAFFNDIKACFSNTTGGCGWPQLAGLASNILQILFYIGLFAAGCMVAYAGWLLIAKGGSDDARGKAKKIFRDIVFGLILLFSAYYIVDLILTKLGVTAEFREGFVEPSNTNTQ